MKSFIFLTLLSVLFVSPYAFAQVTSCPCDTAELENGNTGDEIVAILCPGGHLAAGNESILDTDEVLVRRPGGERLELGYEVGIEDVEGGDKFCAIFEDTVGNLGFKLDDEEYEFCRTGLIERCGLLGHNIPTLSEWGMIAAAAGLGLVGLLFAVRRNRLMHDA